MMAMKVLSSMTQEKLVVPRLLLSRFGRPNRPSPLSRVPTRQAAISETMVLRVRKESTIAMIGGMMEMKPRDVNSFMVRSPLCLFLGAKQKRQLRTELTSACFQGGCPERP